MIYVFYHNDPLAQDLGGGAEHFRCLHRALTASELPFRLIAARLQYEASADEIHYISRGSGFLRFYLALWAWFWRRRGRFSDEDVFHFHRNYAAWPKLLLAPRLGRVLVSYHNVTGRVLEGWLGRLATPLRRVMLAFERRVAALADAIICVSGRDRRELARTVAAEPFSRAHVVPAAYDQTLFQTVQASPPAPELARRLLILGRLSHQKNVPSGPGDPRERSRTGGESWRLTIAGRGEGSKELIRLIARSPAAADIQWIGAVPHDEVPALLRDHGILLLTSRYEASPTVVKEALRAMRPVVSTDVGDVADWLETDRTGFICESTPEALATGAQAACRSDRGWPLPADQPARGARRGAADERGADPLPTARDAVRPTAPAWWPGAGTRRLATLGIARGLASAFGLAGVLLVAHALTPAELGRWSLALAVQGYALHLGEFGLRSVVTTEAGRTGSRLQELLRRYLALRLALSLAALGAVTLGSVLGDRRTGTHRAGDAGDHPDRPATRLAGPGRRSRESSPPRCFSSAGAGFLAVIAS